MYTKVEQDIGRQIVAPGDEAEINLVFVHGIGSSWEQTWCASDQSILWLSTLLPNEFPAARIFIYGYDVMTATDPSPGYGFCRYLNQLAAEDTRKLPIIFIGHSLGGLIIQDALLLSRIEVESSSILDRISGIIFLGTPFFTQEKDWKTFGNHLMQTTKTTQLPDSIKLTQLRDASVDFRDLLKTKAGSSLPIWCFFEILPIYRLGILVSQSSAIIDPNKSSPLQADHFGLSKSEGPWDSRYQTICATLRRMCCNDREISPIPGRKKNESADNREIVIEAIKNEGFTDNREIAIESITNEESISSTLEFALILEDQGHLTDAALHYEKIIVNRKITSTRHDQIILFCEDKLASIYRDNGSRAAKAQSLYKVLEEKLNSWNNTDVVALHSAANLALFLRDQGNYEEALRVIQGNLRSATQNCYQNISHVKLVGILGAIFMDLQNPELSLFLSRNVLSACEELLGPYHSFTLDQASNLALVLSELGEYRFAEMIDRRVLDTLEQCLGPNHPRCLKITNWLANNLRIQKDYEGAVALFTRTLKVQETQLGSSHRDTLSTKCGLAATYALQGRYNDSERLLLQVNKKYIEMLANDHPDFLWAQKALQCLQRIGVSNSQSCTLENGNNPGDVHQGFTELFSAISFRVVAKTDLDRLVQSAMPSLIGTLLHKACFDGNEKKIEEVLMQPNPDINAQAGIFGTPLCVASFKGHTSIVKWLLNAGANPDTNGNLHNPALRIAVMMHRTEITQDLLEKKANPNIMDRWYGTPLQEAAMTGQSSIVKLLLEFGGKHNLRGGLLGFPLLAAAWIGDVKIVKSLLRAGAFLHAQAEGKTALYLAQVEGHKQVINKLYRTAARRETFSMAQNKPGNAPRQGALGQGDAVLEQGNSVDAHKYASSTPSSSNPVDFAAQILKDLQKSQSVEADSTRTNGHAKSMRELENPPKLSRDDAEKLSVVTSGDLPKTSRGQRIKGFWNNKSKFRFHLDKLQFKSKLGRKQGLFDNSKMKSSTSGPDAMGYRAATKALNKG